MMQSRLIRSFVRGACHGADARRRDLCRCWHTPGLNAARRPPVPAPYHQMERTADTMPGGCDQPYPMAAVAILAQWSKSNNEKHLITVSLSVYWKAMPYLRNSLHALAHCSLAPLVGFFHDRTSNCRGCLPDSANHLDRLDSRRDLGHVRDQSVSYRSENPMCSQRGMALALRSRMLETGRLLTQAVVT